MFQTGIILPQFLAEAHIQLHVEWARFAVTMVVFLGLAAGAIYLETRHAKSRKK